MSYISNNVFECIGNTPLLRLLQIESEYSLHAQLFAKVEKANPGGSIKDRVAQAMIADAEKRGLLTPGGIIIEPTSGNTGIGLALVGVPKGYRVVLCMPESMSVERRNLLAAFGAELVLTDASKGMLGCIEEAQRLAVETKGSFIPSQFDNPANPAVHEATTGPEIWRDTQGEVDALVAGVGTGGTITGTGRYLRSKNTNIHIVAVEPSASPMLSEGHSGPHPIQGIGANFIPGVLDRNIYNEVLTVEGDEAFEVGRILSRKEGLLCGVSSAAALSAAIRIAKRAEFAKKRIVVILPDTGERYLSTPMFTV